MKKNCAILLLMIILFGCNQEPTINITLQTGAKGLAVVSNNHLWLYESEANYRRIYSCGSNSTIDGLAVDSKGAIIFAQNEIYRNSNISNSVFKLHPNGSLDTLYYGVAPFGKFYTVVGVSPSGNKVYMLTEKYSQDKSAILDCDSKLISYVDDVFPYKSRNKIEYCFNTEEDKIFRRELTNIFYRELNLTTGENTPLYNPNLEKLVDEQAIINQGMFVNRIDLLKYTGFTSFDNNYCYVNPGGTALVYLDDSDDKIKYINLLDNRRVNLFDITKYPNTYLNLYTKPVWNADNFSPYNLFTQEDTYTNLTQSDLDNIEKLNSSSHYYLGTTYGFNLLIITMDNSNTVLQAYIKGEPTTEKFHAGESFVKANRFLAYSNVHPDQVLVDAQINNYSIDQTKQLWQIKIDSLNSELTRISNLKHLGIFNLYISKFREMAETRIKLETAVSQFLDDFDVDKLNKRVLEIIPEAETKDIGYYANRMRESELNYSLLSSYLISALWQNYSSGSDYVKANINLTERYLEILELINN